MLLGILIKYLFNNLFNVLTIYNKFVSFPLQVIRVKIWNQIKTIKS
jgi:hypothetical protein